MSEPATNPSDAEASGQAAANPSDAEAGGQDAASPSGAEASRASTLLQVLGGLAVLALGFGLVVVADRQGWLGGTVAGPSACQHSLQPAECPWCTPARVQAGGQCAEHGVPAALCSRCDAALIPGFKAQGD